MSFDWILHARYMGAGAGKGNRGYGGEDVSSTCFGRAENFFVPYNLDVSRTLNYFSSDTKRYLGNTGLSGSEEAANFNKQVINRAVHFMNNVYVLLGENVYIYDEVAKTWSISLVLTGKAGTESNSIGLYPVFIKNIPHLITVWNTSGATWQSAKLNGDTNIWSLGSTGSVFDPTDSSGGILNEIQHKDRIYFISSITNLIGWYDFIRDKFGTITWGSTVRHPMDFVTYIGKLYCLNKDSSRNIQVHRIDLTGTTLLINPAIVRAGDQGPGGEQTGAALSTTSQLQGRNLLFVDNVRVDASGLPVLWVMNMAHADTMGTTNSDFGLAFAAYAFDVNGLFTGAHGFSPNASFWSNPFKMGRNQVGVDEKFIPKDEDMTMRLFIDQRERELSPNSISRIQCSTRFGGFCGFTSDNGSLYAGGGGDFNYLVNWIWLGGGAPGSDLSNVGGANSWQPVYGVKEARHRSFPHEKIGGGARSSVILSDGNKNIDIVFRGTDTTDQDGTMRIFYQFITTPGIPNGTNVAVKWYFDENLHAPESRCVPTGTSAGSIDGFEAVSIPADSGTIYYFDWHVTSSNVPYGTRINLNGVVTTADVLVTPLNNPTDLDGLTLWLDADDEATITSGLNGRVSVWNDKSSAGFVSGVVQTIDADEQPFYIVDANNGLGGISFDAASGSFLFSSGSPVDFEPNTFFVIYEPASIGIRQTIFSVSNDDAFYTWGGIAGVGAPSGTVIGSGEYYNIETSGDIGSMIASAQDLFRANEGVLPKEFALTSGAIINEAKLIWWTEDSFQSFGNFHPDGSEPSGLSQTSNSAVAGLVTPSGYVDASGVSFSNTTVGRFSGAQQSGIYIDSGKPYDGIIYEVATYNRVLFELEIDRFILYASGKYNLI